MQTNQQGARESFAAGIARRMLAQSGTGELDGMRERANELQDGFSVTAQSVEEQLFYQQIMAGAAIQRVWPADEAMLLVSRETTAKAVAGRYGAEDGTDDEETSAPRMQG